MKESPDALLLVYSYAHSPASLGRRQEADNLIEKVRSVYESPQLDWQHLRFLENFHDPKEALKFVIDVKEVGKFDRPLHDELCDFYGRQDMTVFQEHCLIEYQKHMGKINRM